MTSRLKEWTIVLVVLAIVVPGTAPVGAADRDDREAPARVTRIDFDGSEPFRVRAKVMELRPAKGTFVLTEREICETDVVTAAGHLQTAYFDLTGQPREKLALKVGQWVLVKGYLLPEGYVAATEIRAIEKPEEKRVPYKPVTAQAKGKRDSRGRGSDLGQR